MAEFDWADPLLIEQELSDEERMVRDNARRFCEAELAPRVREDFRHERFDRGLMEAMGRMGFLGATLPEEEGGAGLEPCRLWADRARGRARRFGLPLALKRAERAGDAPHPRLWQPEQKKKYLPKLAKGELLGCFGLTEPDHGSDPGSMTTRATKAPGGFRLNGAKTWITNSPYADVAVVWAKADDERIRGFPGRARHERILHAQDRRQVQLCAVRPRARSCWKTASCPKRTCSPT